MTVDAALLDRAGELKGELVAFSRRPGYDRAFREVLARHGGSEVLDEQRLMMLWDYFVLEHRLRNGRTVVEQFVDAHPELSRQEREMLLGWRDVVQGPFEVQRRDDPALIVVNLVDDLTYRGAVQHGHLGVPADAAPIVLDHAAGAGRRGMDVEWADERAAAG